MRLREIQKKVSEELPKIKVNSTLIQSNTANNGKYHLRYFQETIAAVEAIAEFNFINKEVAELKVLDFIYFNKSIENIVIIDKATLDNYSEVISRIISKSIAVLDVATESLPENEENAIDVKLPNFKSLKATSAFFSDLEKALEIAVVNKDINGKVELKSFESGSLWISIVLGTALAVDLVGQIASTALKLKERYYQIEQLKSMTKSMDIVNETQVLLLGKLDETFKEDVKASSGELLEKSGIEVNPEYLSRFTYSVETITKLIYQGAEVHASLQASKETKEKFPEFPQIATATKKLLKETSDPDEEGEGGQEA